MTRDAGGLLLPAVAIGSSWLQQLWFSPPDSGAGPRRTLTRERLVAEAVAVIGTDGLDALSMRGRAIRLGVVPAPCTGTCAAMSGRGRGIFPRWLPLVKTSGADNRDERFAAKYPDAAQRDRGSPAPAGQ